MKEQVKKDGTKKPKSEKKSSAKIKITLTKGVNGSLVAHKRTVQALGLKKIGQTVEHDDNKAIRGMIFTVQHLIKVE
jgi:large subunit ribosomal protein L30